MFKDNQIRDLGDNQVKKENSLIPRPSFCGYIASSRGSGKSVLLVNTLLNPNIFFGKFNQLYIINPTSGLDKKWQLLKNKPGILKANKPLIKLIKSNHSKIIDNEDTTSNYNTTVTDENFISTVSIKFLQDIIEEQKYIINTYGKDVADEVLLIFDDTIAQRVFWASEQVQNMIFLSRHYKVSLIITSQSYKSLPKGLRLNMTFVCLFYTANVDELKSIYSENSNNTNFKEFLEIFKKVCFSKAFNFLTINYQSDQQHRLQSAFDKFVT